MQKHDVFISYAHLDNEGDWVSEFDRVFKTFLSTWLGRPANIWRDKTMGTGDYIWDTIEEHLLRSRIIIPIISPSYLNSEWCPRELKVFIEHNREKVGTKSAVFNVRRVPVEKDEIPDEIRDVLENVLYREFFKREETGKVRILAPDRGDEVRRKFLNNLEDLAQDVFETLRKVESAKDDQPEIEAKPDAVQPFRGKRIYLSEPSPDMIEDYLEIKRDFLNRGATLFPVSILEAKPPTIKEYEAKIAGEMGQCDLVVHFVGSEDEEYSESQRESVVQTQSEIAAECQEKAGFTRLILIPKDVAPNTERQQEFVQRLMEFTSKNVDLLRNSLDLKTQMEKILLDETAAQSGTHAPKDFDAKEKSASVYLLYDKEDESLGKNIMKRLFDQGCEVWTVSKSAESEKADLIEEHKWYLSNCDAALVCWGNAKMFRVRKMMSEFVSIMNNGREKDFVDKGVLIDGTSPEKDNFMTHETVVRSESDLSGFVAGISSGDSNE